MSEQKLREALQRIKAMVCGERVPYWVEDGMTVTGTRGAIADICDMALDPALQPPTSDEGTPEELYTLTDDILGYLRQLSPHVRSREAARLLQRSVDVLGYWCSKKWPALERTLHAKERELEQRVVQLAGCGVAAMSNTRESLERAKEVTPGSYGWSASYGDCLKAAEREIELREQLAAPPAAPQSGKKEDDKDAERYRWQREHVDSEHCWCCPTLNYVAENGNKVWVHHDPT